ncbi:MbtH family protein [Streptomyces pacificus]|uniref:MbtH family protein n=1 Tax=Streptomyces pacificus TaxID=2705029 RepID=A0A6A0ARV5_9ACTN|nr:MbtH family protein [Streptomyces pacificus]GFH35646.1 MbtH family protein [Streptomyces pacificus]
MSGNPFDDGSEDGGPVVTGAAGRYTLRRPRPDVPKGRRIVHSCPDRDGARNHAGRHFTAAVGTQAA